MTKWEYFPLTNLERLDHHALNALGREGWELVSVLFEQRVGWVYIFKRPERLTLKK